MPEEETRREKEDGGRASATVTGEARGKRSPPDAEQCGRSVYSEQQALECEILLDDVSDTEDGTPPDDIILNSSVDEEFGPPKYDPVAEQEAIDRYKLEIQKKSFPTNRAKTDECKSTELDPERAGTGLSSGNSGIVTKKEPTATYSGALDKVKSAKIPTTTDSGNLKDKKGTSDMARVGEPSMINNRAQPPPPPRI